MRLSTPHGSYLTYSIEKENGNEIIHLEDIKSYHPGDGSLLVKELQNLGMRIELYAYPQDGTCTIEDLRAFYEKLGFELHPDDVDYSYYVW